MIGDGSNKTWWIFAAVALGALGFVSLDNSIKERKSKPPVTGDARRLTFGFMKPFVIPPGSETVPIQNYEGTHLIWYRMEGASKPTVYCRFGKKGAWVKGCPGKCWAIKFVLPAAAKEAVTMGVERRKGKFPGGSKIDCNDEQF